MSAKSQVSGSQAPQMLKSLLSDSTRRFIWLNLYFDNFNAIKLNRVSLWCVCSGDTVQWSLFVFWQITLDDDATEKARHVFKGNSFNKTLEFGIKFFHNRNLISIIERQAGAIEKILKINLRLFLFILAGTFSARQTIGKNMQQKNSASCIFLSIFNQCSITKTSQETLFSVALFVVFVLNSEQLISKICEMNALGDFLWFWFFLCAILQYWNDDNVGPTTLFK